jgi:hypothetical protein
MQCLGCDPFGIDMLPEIDMGEMLEAEEVFESDFLVLPTLPVNNQVNLTKKSSSWPKA